MPATLSTMSGTATTDHANVQTEALWKDFHKALRAFFRKRVRCEYAAEDLLQEAFLRIHKGIESVADEAKLRGWIYRIARNLVVDYYRSQRLTEELGEHAAPEADANASDAIALGACVQRMVQTLSPTYQEALQLVEVEGISQTEAAKRLGLSVSGAKSRIQRGRTLLKDVVTGCCQIELDRRGHVLDHQCSSECC